MKHGVKEAHFIFAIMQLNKKTKKQKQNSIASLTHLIRHQLTGNHDLKFMPEEATNGRVIYGYFHSGNDCLYTC